MGETLDGEAAFDYLGYKVSENYDGSVITVSSYRNHGSGTDADHVKDFQNGKEIWAQIGFVI